MAIQHPRRRKFLESIGNTGFSTGNNIEGGRLTNKDGSLNLRKTGRPFWERISLYHTILAMPLWKFITFTFLFYTVLNVFFASIYIIIGVENLKGIIPTDDVMNNFQQAFFFSSQTLTTVGYGHISPFGLATNIVASLESFTGILAFALVTGILYGRFSRPRAYLQFSDNLLIAPYKGMRAVMMRMATYKNNHLTDVEADVTIAMYLDENGIRTRKFFSLELEIRKINSLALSWTLVHPINEESPLYGMSEDEMRNADMEILYFLKGFDDHFSNVVKQRTSYRFSEFVFGAKFIPMFQRSEDNNSTILDLSKINEFESVALPELEKSAINA